MAPHWWDGLYSPPPFGPDGRHSDHSRPVFWGDELCWLDNGLHHSPQFLQHIHRAILPLILHMRYPSTSTGLVVWQRSTLSRYGSILRVENDLDGTLIGPHRCPPCGHNNPSGTQRCPASGRTARH